MFCAKYSAPLLSSLPDLNTIRAKIGSHYSSKVSDYAEHKPKGDGLFLVLTATPVRVKTISQLERRRFKRISSESRHWSLPVAHHSMFGTPTTLSPVYRPVRKKKQLFIIDHNLLVPAASTRSTGKQLRMGGLV